MSTPLISHRFPIQEGVRAYEMITGKTEEPFLGVVLTYPETGDDLLESGRTVTVGDSPPLQADKVSLGALGAGNFAQAVIFPAAAKDAWSKNKM